MSLLPTEEELASGHSTFHHCGSHDSVCLLAQDHSTFARKERTSWFLQQLLARKSDPSAELLPSTQDSESRRANAYFTNNGTALAAHLLYSYHSGQQEEKEEAAELPPPCCLLSESSKDTFLKEGLLLRCSKQQRKQQRAQEEKLQRLRQAKEEEDRELSSAAQPTSTAPVLALHARSQVATIYCKYRVVFSLDVSPSMATLCAGNDTIVLDQVLPALKQCLLDLVKPITVPALNLQIVPELYISVIAQGTATTTFSTLLQGCLLTSSNVRPVIRKLKAQLKQLECSFARLYQQQLTPLAPDLRSTLQNSVFALTMLPRDACPVIVLMTDGVSALPDLRSYDNYVMLLNREDIACSVIQLDSNRAVHCLFGYVPDTEMLRYLSLHTGGNFMRSIQDCANNFQLLYETDGTTGTRARFYACMRATALQFNLLLKDFCYFKEQEHGLNLDKGQEDNEYPDLNIPFPWNTDHAAPPQPSAILGRSKTKWKEYDLPEVSLWQLLDVRLQEGFYLSGISYDSEQSFSLWLSLAWQPDVVIEYSVECNDPKAHPGKVMQITINVLAFPQFIHRFDLLQKGGAHQLTLGQSSPLHKFLHQLSQTDRVLRSLVSKSNLMTTLCRSTILKQDENTDRRQHNPLEEAKKEFSSLLPSLRGRLHRWFSTEKVEVVLKEDNLFFLHSGWDSNANASGTGGDFQYRRAREALLAFCTKWSTFNFSHSIFVKLLNACDRSATSGLGGSYPQDSIGAFCLLRLSWETNSLVALHLAYFAPTNTRISSFAEFKQQLADATVPVDEYAYYKGHESHSRICPFFFCSKLFRPVLIRYDPQSLTSAEEEAVATDVNKFVPTAPSPTMPLLTSHLWKRRWAWVMSTSPDTRNVATELLVATRIREQWLPTSTASNFVSFVKDIHLRVSSTHSMSRGLPCILQYVLYHREPNIIATELWMEPQYGKFQFLAHHKRHTIASEELFDCLVAELHHADGNIISALCSFDYIAEQVNNPQAKTDPVSNLSNGRRKTRRQRDATQYWVERPRINLHSLIAFGTHAEETYSLLQRLPSAVVPEAPSAAQPSTKAKSAKRDSPLTLFQQINAGIHTMLSKTLYILSDCRLPVHEDNYYTAVISPRTAEHAQPGSHVSLMASKIHDLKGYQCFAKLMSNTRVVLAVLPPLNSLQEDGADTVTIHFYECAKERVGHLSKTHPYSDAIHFLFDGSSSSDVSEENKSELEESSPEPLQPLTGNNPILTTSAMLFCQAVRQLYERNFVKAVYTALRDGIPVHPNDLERAHNCCISYPLEVDITPFVLTRKETQDIVLKRRKRATSMPPTSVPSSAFEPWSKEAKSASARQQAEKQQLLQEYQQTLQERFYDCMHLTFVKSKDGKGREFFFYAQRLSTATGVEDETGAEEEGEDDEEAETHGYDEEHALFWKEEEQFFTPTREYGSPLIKSDDEYDIELVSSSPIKSQVSNRQRQQQNYHSHHSGGSAHTSTSQLASILDRKHSRKLLIYPFPLFLQVECLLRINHHGGKPYSPQAANLPSPGPTFLLPQPSPPSSSSFISPSPTSVSAMPAFLGSPPVPSSSSSTSTSSYSYGGAGGRRKRAATIVGAGTAVDSGGKTTSSSWEQVIPVEGIPTPELIQKALAEAEAELPGIDKEVLSTQNWSHNRVQVILRFTARTLAPLSITGDSFSRFHLEESARLLRQQRRATTATATPTTSSSYGKIQYHQRETSSNRRALSLSSSPIHSIDSDSRHSSLWATGRDGSSISVSDVVDLYDDDTSNSSGSDIETEEEGQDHNALLPSVMSYTQLPHPFYLVMTALQQRISSLVSMEVLHLLRLSTNAQPSLLAKRATLDTVLSNIDSLPFPLTWSDTIRLPFLERKEGMKLFLMQLQESCILRLLRVGNVFIAVNTCELVEKLSSPSTFAINSNQKKPSSATAEHDKAVTSMEASSLARIFPPTSNRNHEQAPPLTPELQFWLILIPQTTETQNLVTLRFHTRDLAENQRTLVMEAARSAVHEACRRVNQLLLLWSLYKTNHCSRLLVAPSPDDSDYALLSMHLHPSAWKGSGGRPRSPRTRLLPDSFVQHVGAHNVNPEFFSIDNDDEKNITKYDSYFACPRVHVIELPLHQRMSPDKVVSAIIATALHHFAVSNRKNMFVYREKNGHCFYLMLSAVPAQSTTMASPDTTTSFSPSSLQPRSNAEPHLSAPKATASATDLRANKNSEDGSHSGKVNQKEDDNNSNPDNEENDATRYKLVVEIFGVYEAGPEITEQLHQLLENKLAAVTLSIISALLLRNPLLKLTPEDLAFIRSSNTPAQKCVVRIPSAVFDKYLYLLFLRQNLLQSSLHTMHFLYPPGEDSENSVSGQAEERNGAKAERDQPQSNSGRLCICPSDFAFLYNHIPSPSTTATQKAIGQGIACIYLNLLDEEGLPLQHVCCPGPPYEPSQQQAEQWLHVCQQKVFLRTCPPLARKDRHPSRAGNTSPSTKHSASESPSRKSHPPSITKQSAKEDHLDSDDEEAAEAEDKEKEEDEEEDDDEEEEEQGKEETEDGDFFEGKQLRSLSDPLPPSKPRRSTLQRHAKGDPTLEENQGVEELHQLYEPFGDGGGTEEGSRLQIEIWVRGAIHMEALIAHLTRSMRQTLCAFALETCILQLPLPPPPAPLTDTRKSLFKIASSLSAPSVQRADIPLNLVSWSVQPLVHDLLYLLSELNPTLLPAAVYFSRATTTSGKHLASIDASTLATPLRMVMADPFADISSPQSLSPESRLLRIFCPGGRIPTDGLLHSDDWTVTIVAGSNEEAPSSFSPTTTTPIANAISTSGGDSERIAESRDQTHTTEGEGSGNNATPATTSINYEDLLLYSHLQGFNLPSSIIRRRCFVHVELKRRGLKLYTYNWNKALTAKIHSILQEHRRWDERRQNLLGNIVQQKLGLFTHPNLHNRASSQRTALPKTEASVASSEGRSNATNPSSPGLGSKRGLRQQQPQSQALAKQMPVPRHLRFLRGGQMLHPPPSHVAHQKGSSGSNNSREGGRNSVYPPTSSVSMEGQSRSGRPLSSSVEQKNAFILDNIDPLLKESTVRPEGVLCPSTVALWLEHTTSSQQRQQSQTSPSNAAAGAGMAGKEAPVTLYTSDIMPAAVVSTTNVAGEDMGSNTNTNNTPSPLSGGGSGGAAPRKRAGGIPESNVPLQGLLKGCIPQQPLHRNTSLTKSSNVMIRHGQHIKEGWLHHIFSSRNRNHLQAICSRWIRDSRTFSSTTASPLPSLSPHNNRPSSAVATGRPGGDGEGAGKSSTFATKGGEASLAHVRLVMQASRIVCCYRVPFPLATLPPLSITTKQAASAGNKQGTTRSSRSSLRDLGELLKNAMDDSWAILSRSRQGAPYYFDEEEQEDAHQDKQWLEDIMHDFFANYVHYLQVVLGLTKLNVQAPPSSLSTTKQRPSASQQQQQRHQQESSQEGAAEEAAKQQGSSISLPPAFLYRATHGGILLLHVAFMDGCMLCDLYALHNRELVVGRTAIVGGLPSPLYHLSSSTSSPDLPRHTATAAMKAHYNSTATPSSSSSNRTSQHYQQHRQHPHRQQQQQLQQQHQQTQNNFQLRQLFVEEAHGLKHRLHLNSFVYDFHAQQLQAFLTNVTMPYPPGYFLAVLHGLVNAYSVPPPYARNQVVAHSSFLPLPAGINVSSPDLFLFISKHASTYGLRTLEQRHIHPALFFSSSSPTFQTNDSEDTRRQPYLYSVVAFVLPTAASSSSASSPAVASSSASTNNSSGGGGSGYTGGTTPTTPSELSSFVPMSSYAPSSNSNVVSPMASPGLSAATTPTTASSSMVGSSTTSTQHIPSMMLPASSASSSQMTTATVAESRRVSLERRQLTSSIASPAAQTTSTCTGSTSGGSGVGISSPIGLRFFIIRTTTQGVCVPLSSARTTTSTTSSQEEEQLRREEEDSASGGFMVRVAERRLAEAITGAAMDYHRDQLWLRLLTPNSIPLSETELAVLMRLADWKPLEELDPSLAILFSSSSSMSVPWCSAMRYLEEEVYRKRCRHITYRSGEHVTTDHLFLLSVATRDFFVHVTHSAVAGTTSRHTTNAYACRRLPRSVLDSISPPGSSSGVGSSLSPRSASPPPTDHGGSGSSTYSRQEQDHIRDFINALCCFLTRSLLAQRPPQ